MHLRKSYSLGIMGITLAIAASSAHASKLYFADQRTEKIQRANLDGTELEDLIADGIRKPRGIALDIAAEKMYWTDEGDSNVDDANGRVMRANLDGSDVEELVTEDVRMPRGIALDLFNGKMYWTDEQTDAIRRANLDGSDVEDLITSGTKKPKGIALDLAAGKMYWTDDGDRGADDPSGKVRRANLDGSDIEDLVTEGIRKARSIALDLESGKMYWTDEGEEGDGGDAGRGRIRRANLDGSDIQTVISLDEINKPKGIALDVPNGQMYWTDERNDDGDGDDERGRVRRADLGGANIEDLITTGLREPAGIALDLVPVIFVDVDAEDGGDGLSWETAFNDLQDGLAAATEGNVIRVADGVYKPTDGGDRGATFELLAGMSLFGGYAGISGPNPNERDPIAHETVLSGDIGAQGDPSDNSHHVVTASAEGDLDGLIIFDGFIVTGGRATGTGDDQHGGGLANLGATMSIGNARFSDNVAAGNGGAMANFNDSELVVINALFAGNSAGGSGGGMWNSEDTVVSLGNVAFSANTARDGGAMFNDGADASIANSTFSANSATMDGGGIHNAKEAVPTIANTVLWANSDSGGQDEGAQIHQGASDVTYSCIEGWTNPGVDGNINMNPQFADSDGEDNALGTLDDNVRLAPGSPCIDAANNNAVPADARDLDRDGNRQEPLPIDLDGFARFFDDESTDDTGIGDPPIVDMGAQEFFPDCNNNGVPDDEDIANGTSEDKDGDGIPDECSEWAGEKGGDNFWGTALNWDPPAIPNNTEDRTFAVEIMGADATPTLNIDATIDSLRLLDGASLNIAKGSLTIETTAGILNDGILFVDDGFSINAAASFNVEGVSPITLGDGASLSSTSPEHQMTNMTTIEGEGVIDANFANKGVVSANVKGGTLSIEGDNTKTNDGVFEANNDGTLLINGTNVGGTGDYSADGGTISISPIVGLLAADASVEGGSMEIVNNGVVEVAGDASVRLSGELLINSGGVYQAGEVTDGAASASLEAGTILITGNCDDGSGRMVLEGEMTASADGSIGVNGTTCNGFGLGGGAPPTLELTGSAAVQGTEMEVNGGQVIASDEASIEITNTFTLDGGGIYQGGTGEGGSNSASLTVGELVIQSSGDELNGQMILSDAMSLTTVADIADAVGRGDVNILGCPVGGVGGCTPPIFEGGARANARQINNTLFGGMTQAGGDGVEITIGGTFFVNGLAQVRIGPLVDVSVSGNFDIREVDPALFDWADGSLLLNGVEQIFEVAGEDLGPTPDGFINNYAMGTIEVAPGTHVTIQNEVRGITATNCAGALYVHDLILREGSSIKIFITAVYYEHLIDEGAEIDLGNQCSKLIQIEE